MITHNRIVFPDLHMTGRVKFRIAVIIALVLLFLIASRAEGQSVSDGRSLFGGKCYSCHNVGAGDKQGPDLKGATTRRSKEWLREFIKAPAAMNSKGDAAATELFKRFSPTVMPDQSLTPEQIDSILALIEELSAKNQQFIPEGARLSRAVLPSDVNAGMQIFTGRSALKGGGTACISCHSINGAGALGGGTLGPDLTVANVKYTDPELISILQNPNFPTMASVFANRKLTDEEIVQLFALFQDAKLKNKTAISAQAGTTRIDPTFLFIGIFALVIMLAAMNLIWRNRLRGVREELVKRSARI
jgi:mono/diheme cytochrome c family protein